MKLAFCDIETTGFSREHHDIIELAAIIWDTVTDTIVDTFHEYIKPGHRIPAEITAVTGITNSQVANSRRSWDVLPDFYAWLKANKVDSFVGHNFKSFDKQFLVGQSKRYELDKKFGINFESIEVIDTMTIARKLVKEGRISVENVKQPTLAAFYNIEYRAHSAIEDVKALIQIYKNFRKIDLNLK
jgi:DNA polymerase III alpha subunit (gram-positive type)